MTEQARTITGIPALLTLKSGTVISAADARFGGTHDSPNNIDIAVARSEDGGKNWSKPELTFHYEDYEDNTLEIPVGTQTRRIEVHHLSIRFFCRTKRQNVYF